MKIGDFNVTHSLRNGAVELDFRQYYKLSLLNRFTLILNKDNLTKILYACESDRRYDHMVIKTYGMGYSNADGKPKTILGNKNDTSTSIGAIRSCNDVIIIVSVLDNSSGRELGFSICVSILDNRLNKFAAYLKKIIRELG